MTYKSECNGCGKVIKRNSLTLLTDAERKHRKKCFEGFKRIE